MKLSSVTPIPAGINDKEPKYGLAVTGVVDPKLLLTKGGSKPGQVLMLTKKLGAGVVTTALKQQIAKDGDVAIATESMKTLNNRAADAARAAGAQSVTDVTGFGLMGHAHEMAHLGHVGFRIFTNSLQWLPGTVEYGESGAYPGGMDKNKHFFSSWISTDNAVPELIGDLMLTPETSGGLLMAVSPEKVNIVQDFCPEAFVIGEVVPGEGQIEIVP